MGLAILLGVFLFSMLAGIPIAFALGVAALCAALFEGIPPLIVFQRMVAGMNIFSFLAIPFFIFAGELMMRGGIAMRLVKFANALVGRLRGGLGVVNVLTSMLFGGISGSAVADTSALGSVLIPLMKEKGYDDDNAVNVTVTSSLAGVMVPPQSQHDPVCACRRRRHLDIIAVSRRRRAGGADVRVPCRGGLRRGDQAGGIRRRSFRGGPQSSPAVWQRCPA